MENEVTGLQQNKEREIKWLKQEVNELHQQIQAICRHFDVYLTSEVERKSFHVKKHDKKKGLECAGSCYGESIN